MIKHRISQIGSLCASLLFVLAGCGGGSTDDTSSGASSASSGSSMSTTSSGGTGGGDAGVPADGLSPLQLFRGRAVDLTIYRAGETFSESAVIKVGSGPIEVVSVKLVDSSTLRARVRVPLDAAEESADVTVDGKPFGALKIADAVALFPPTVAFPRGEPVQFELINLDPTHPFSEKSRPEPIPGVHGGPTSIRPDGISMVAIADLDAPIGKGSIVFHFPDDPDGEKVLSRVKDGFEVNEGPFKPVSEGVPATVTGPVGVEQVGLALTLGGNATGKFIDLSAQASQVGGPKSIPLAFALLDPSQGGAPLSPLTGGATIAAEVPHAGSYLAWVFFPGGPYTIDTAVTVNMKTITPTPFTVAAPGSLSLDATPITLPAIIDAQFAPGKNKAVFTFNPPKGTLVVRMLQPKGAGPDETLDPSLELLDDALKRIADNDNEYANSIFPLIETPITAGKRFLRVRASDDGVVTTGKFRMLVYVR